MSKQTTKARRPGRPGAPNPTDGATRRVSRQHAFQANVTAVFTVEAHTRDTCNLVLAPESEKRELCRAILHAKANRAAPLHTVAPARLWPTSGSAVFWGDRNRTPTPVWPPRTR